MVWMPSSLRGAEVSGKEWGSSSWVWRHLRDKVEIMRSFHKPNGRRGWNEFYDLWIGYRKASFSTVLGGARFITASLISMSCWNSLRNVKPDWLQLRHAVARTGGDAIMALGHEVKLIHATFVRPLRWHECRGRWSIVQKGLCEPSAHITRNNHWKGVEYW